MAKARKRAPGGGRKPRGPVSNNDSVLQARIANSLRQQLEDAAQKNGRSLSQEAQDRLRRSFGVSAKLEQAWGPPDAKVLAYLVSRLVRGVHSSVGANPFQEAGDLAWHRNLFTHAAVSAAITTILAHYKPVGSAETPPEVKKRSEWVPPEQAEAVTTPESVGQSCALGLINQLAIHRQPPPRSAANVTHGESHHILPDINKILGDDDD